MRRLLILTGLLVLGGCARTVSQNGCPTVAPWSVTDQLALKRDLSVVQSPLIHRALREDADYRAWASRCRGKS